MAVFSTKKPFGVIDYVIGFLILVQILVAGLPLIFSGFQNLSVISDLPFASFFQSGGVMYIVIGAVVIKGIIEGTKGGKGR